MLLLFTIKSIIEKVDLNSNVQKINLGTSYWPISIKASVSGRVGYIYHEWEFRDAYLFRDYNPDFSSYREYRVNIPPFDYDSITKFGFSYTYDKHGTKILFDSDLPYSNQSYRILNNNDTSEIYTMSLNSGIISRLTNNSFFDGYSSILSSDFNQGFGISSNSNRKLKAIKRYKERLLPRLKKRQEKFDKFKKYRKK